MLLSANNPGTSEERVTRRSVTAKLQITPLVLTTEIQDNVDDRLETPPVLTTSLVMSIETLDNIDGLEYEQGKATFVTVIYV